MSKGAVMYISKDYHCFEDKECQHNNSRAKQTDPTSYRYPI